MPARRRRGIHMWQIIIAAGVLKNIFISYVISDGYFKYNILIFTESNQNIFSDMCLFIHLNRKLEPETYLLILE